MRQGTVSQRVADTVLALQGYFTPGPGRVVRQKLADMTTRGWVEQCIKQ